MPKSVKRLKTLKVRLWKLFSEYIRLKYANPDGFVTCVTCGTSKQWNEMQAGHFLAGRMNSILFIEENVHPQCMGCNVFKHGNGENYYPFMLATYGQAKIDELKQHKYGGVVKFYPEWYEIMIDKYSALVALKKKELGL